MKKEIQTYISSFLLLLLSAQSPKLFSAAAAASAKDSSDFILAAEQGDVKKVQGFLDKGIDIETIDGREYTALMLAAHNGNTDLIDILCMHKADINARDADGDTSLMLAALCGDELVLKHLLLLGANYSFRDSFNNELEEMLLMFQDNSYLQVFHKHKQDLLELVVKYKKIDTKKLQSLRLIMPPQEYPGRAEEQLARHQTDIVSIKKVLFIAELDPIFNEINLLGEMADYLEPFIEE